MFFTAVKPLTTVHRQTWLAVAFFTLLAVLFTWPLAIRLTHSVVGWPGDNYYFVWLVGWFQKAIVALVTAEPNIPLLAVPQLNYPDGWNLAYNEITPAMVLLALPGSWLSGPVFGYNVSILLSFILSGLGVFWWVRRLTGNCCKEHSFVAGLLAGTAFAFAPYRMAHLYGHLNLMGTQWLPLYFMTFTDLLQTQRSSWRTIGLPALFLGLIAATSQYYLYMTLLLSLVYTAGYLVLAKRQKVSDQKFWGRLALFAAPALLLAVVSVWPYLRLATQNGLPPRSLDEVRLWSASLTDFVIPSIQHFAWGEWVARHFDRKIWVENNIYIGIITLALAGYAWFVLRKSKNHLAALLALAGLISFILALGTDLHWLGQTVYIPTPAFLQDWKPAPHTAIPLPGYFLFKLLPFYSIMRVWTRYAVFMQLFTSLLAGWGFALLVKSAGKPHYLQLLLSVGVVVLLILDFFPRPLQFSDVSPRPVDYWLAQQPGQGAVAQFPFWQDIQPQHTFYTLTHNKPFIGGFFAANTTSQYRRIQPVLDGFPDTASLELLQELGVEWVIVDLAQYPDASQTIAQIEALGLIKTTELGGQAVYQFK